MSKEVFEALSMFESENGIPIDLLLEKIKQGIMKAVKKEYPDCENINIEIDPDKGKFEVSIVKMVVDGEPADANEIHIDEAKTYSKRARVGAPVSIKLSTKDMGRVAAQSAKQSIRSDIKSFEKDRLMEQFRNKEHEAIAATVQKIEPGTGNAVLSIEKNEIYLFKNEQIPGEELCEGDIIKVYVVAILNKEKKPTLKVSRTHPDLVKRLFELEIPEIYDGTVEIRAISREAGSRTKIAVCSRDDNVDAVGACIGPKRQRIGKIVDELGGEKIDIIVYSEDPAEFIAQALAPADVISVELAEDETRSCTVIVPNTQLSLAIGNKGQNAKLAARLTGYKIDIKAQE